MSDNQDRKGQGIRLGIQYQVNGGWSLWAEAPYINSHNIRLLQNILIDALETYQDVNGGVMSGVLDEYAQSSSPYTHHIRLVWLSHQPCDIEGMLRSLYYGFVVKGNFYNPEEA